VTAFIFLDLHALALAKDERASEESARRFYVWSINEGKGFLPPPTGLRVRETQEVNILPALL
jgi:hypothetical protein